MDTVNPPDAYVPRPDPPRAPWLRDRPLKTFLYAIVAVVVAGVAAVLIAPSFVDWTAYKRDIAQHLSETTGRDVVIRGDVGVEMLPSPRVSLTDVRVASPNDEAETPLARIGTVRIDVRFAPLFKGDVRLAEVTLVRPRLTVERLPGGGWNWRGAAGGLADGALGSLPLGAEARVETLRVQSGRIVYTDRRHAARLTFSDVSGRIAADGRMGPFDAKGRFVWRGRALRASAQIGQLGARGGTAFTVTVRPDGEAADARTRVSGTVTATAPLRASAEIDARGPDAAAVLGALDAGRTARRLLRARPYTASAKVSLDGGTLSLGTLDVTAGDLSLTGRAAVEAGPPVNLDAELRLKRVNLDRFLAEGKAAAAPSGGDADGSTSDGGWRLPTQVRGDIRLSADALIYREEVIRQGRVRLGLEDRRLRVREAHALLPGGSEVDLSGAITTPEGTPRFDGRIEASANNLRGLFDWLGVRLPGVSRDRLRRLDLTGELAARPGRVTLRGMDLGVDTTTVTGGVVVVPGSRPGFGIGVQVDRLDLDAYWRDASSASGSGAGTEADQTTTRRAVLGRFDANLDVQVGTLIAGGRELRDARLKGSLNRGTLTLKELEAKAVAGGPFQAEGEIARVAQPSPSLDLNVAWRDVRPSAASRWLGLTGKLPADWPRVSVSGQLAGEADQLRVNLAIQAGDGLVTLDGDVKPENAGLPGADVRVALQHDSLRRALDAWTALPPLGRDPGTLDLSARLRTGGQSVTASELDGTVGPVSMGGEVTLRLEEDRPQVGLRLKVDALPLHAFALADRDGGGDGVGDWSAAPIGLAALRRADGDVRLRVSELRLNGAAPVHDARLDASLTGGVLDLSEAKGTWGGGTARLTGTLDAGGTPTVQATLNLADVDASALGTPIAGLRPAGPVSVSGDVSARGRSERALVETLTGEGTIEGTLRLRPVERRASLLDALFGAKLDGVANVARAADAVDAAFRDREVAVEGTWRVNDGTLRSDAITLAGEAMTARLSGAANLPDWRTDLTLRLRRPHADGTGPPFLDAVLQGPLDTPNLRLSGGGLSIDAPDTPTGPEGPAAPEAPAEPGDSGSPDGEDGAAADQGGADGDAGGPSTASDGAATEDTGSESGDGADTAEQLIEDLLKELPEDAK